MSWPESATSTMQFDANSCGAELWLLRLKAGHTFTYIYNTFFSHSFVHAAELLRWKLTEQRAATIPQQFLYLWKLVVLSLKSGNVLVCFSSTVPNPNNAFGRHSIYWSTSVLSVAIKTLFKIWVLYKLRTCTLQPYLLRCSECGACNFYLWIFCCCQWFIISFANTI